MNLFENLQTFNEVNKIEYDVAFTTKDGLLHHETIMASSKDEAKDIILRKYGDDVEYTHGIVTTKERDEFNKFMIRREIPEHKRRKD